MNSEARDELLAERGERLRKFCDGEPIAEIWPRELLPLIDRVYSAYHQLTLAGDPTALGGQRALQDLVMLISGSVQLGEGAMKRLAVRRGLMKDTDAMK